MRALLLCFAIVVAILYWSNPHLRILVETDTESYVNVAKDLSTREAQDRPPVYPLFLRFNMLFGSSSVWPTLVGIIQMLLVGAAASCLCILFRLIQAPSWFAILGAVFCCSTPGLVSFYYLLLPEVLLAFLLTVCWTCAVLLGTPRPISIRTSVLLAAVCGIFSGLATLTKPLWLLGILPLAAAVYILRRRFAKEHLAKLLILMIALHAAIILPWQIHLIRKFNQHNLSRVGTTNFNLAAIRAGFTHDGAGTPLYNFLDRSGLLPMALALHWEDFDNFTHVKDGLPWEMRTDETFAAAVRKQDLGAYAWLQLKRVPAFFSVHTPTMDIMDFPGLPSIGRALYLRMYSAVFSVNIGAIRFPVFLLLLCVSVVWSIRVERLRPIVITGIFAGLYYMAIVVFLTYQDPLFSRMRVAVEPMLFAVILVPYIDIVSHKVTKIPSLKTS